MSPIGIDAESYWNALVEGKSGVSYLQSLNTQLDARPIGSEVPDFRPKDFIKPKKNIKVMSRDIQMGVVAALLACENANLSLEEGSRTVDPERFGAVFGCDLIGLELDSLLDAFKAGVKDGKHDFSTWGPASMAKIMPLWMLKFLPNMVASHIAIALDARGPNNTATMSRGSSLAALMEATRIIERGAADVMICGGAGSKVNPTLLARGRANEVIVNDSNPELNPRPYDAARRGTVSGEGAAAFILESKEYALARGAKPLATVLGFAECLEPISPYDAQSASIERAARLALKNADRTASDLGHVNGNGLGASVDALEAAALAKVVGDVPVFAAGGSFGDLGGGSGAVELAASLLAVERGLLPPTRNCDNVADDCPINVAKGAAQKLEKPTFLKVNHTRAGRSFAVVLG
ncbi:MAG: beta-ketoacyl-[acyl-carrier-protein] synthase family protein [Thermoguttaceae bacterium]|nr:beta-ketoacyl-[acyl-carrier-protein] synthase family protein [Thermoguttaceae bacterium]